MGIAYTPQDNTLTKTKMSPGAFLMHTRKRKTKKKPKKTEKKNKKNVKISML